jgi:hypothetical protein
MKRLISVVLSLSLILCSCGKGNEPLVKRELIAQPKYVAPPKGVDETSPAGANDPVPKAKEKTIAIKLFDTRDKELGNIEITVKDDYEGTMNVDSLKSLIPKNVCNITKPFFWWSNEGRRYKLTQEAVSIKDIHDIELTCKVPTASSSPKPLDQTKKTEGKKINNKYSYFKIACVVVAVIVATITIVRMVKKCKGKTIARLESDGEKRGTKRWQGKRIRVRNRR